MTRMEFNDIIIKDFPGISAQLKFIANERAERLKQAALEMELYIEKIKVNNFMKE